MVEKYKKINLGCGDDLKKGWVNVDLYNDKADFKRDNVDYLKTLDTDSVDAVLCSHVLEHYSIDNMMVLLLEIKRVLKPGGVFRILSPAFLPKMDHHQGLITPDYFDVLWGKEYGGHQSKENISFIGSAYTLEKKKTTFSIRKFAWATLHLLKSLATEEYDITLKKLK